MKVPCKDDFFNSSNKSPDKVGIHLFRLFFWAVLKESSLHGFTTYPSFFLILWCTCTARFAAVAFSGFVCSKTAYFKIKPRTPKMMQLLRGILCLLLTSKFQLQWGLWGGVSHVCLAVVHQNKRAQVTRVARMHMCLPHNISHSSSSTFEGTKSAQEAE